MTEGEAVLLMGLPEGSDGVAQSLWLDAALERHLPIYCTNPDLVSPRAGEVVQVSPGALAARHAAKGGKVCWYGKPHVPVFRSIENVLGLQASRLLMVGDSLEHDIAGAQQAGWATLFVLSGIHASQFADSADPDQTIRRLCEQVGMALPDFFMEAVS